MPQIKSVSFTSPYDAEAMEIERRRQYADLLRQQSMQPLQTNRMAGRVAIPISPLEGAAKLVQGYSAGQGARSAEEERKKLAERYRTDLADVLRRATQASTGAPATQEAIMDEQARGGEGAPAIINAPAVAADPARAASIYMEHPATQQLGVQEMQRQAQIAALRGVLPQLGSGAPNGGGSGAVPGGGGINPTNPALLNLALMPGGAPLANLISGREIAASKQGIDLQKLQQAERHWNGLSAAQKEDLRLKGINSWLDLAKAVDTGVVPASALPPMPGDATTAPTPQGGTVPQPAPGTPEYVAFKQVQSGAVPTAYVPQGAPKATPSPTPAPAPAQAPGLSPRGAREAAEAAAKKEAEERAKLRVEMPEARQRVQIQHHDLDRLAAAATEIINRNLARATGAMGALPSFPGGRAAQTESLITSLKAQISAMKLQAMREASKTGGAVGQVTEKEWPRLENMIVALDPVKMGPEMMRKKLFELVNEINKVKGSIQQAFDTQYGGGAVPAAPSGFRVLR